MSRRSLVMIVAVVSGVAVASVLYFVERSAPPTAWERNFAFADLERIERIEIADRRQGVYKFERGGPTGWKVNGEPANENVMKNLLQAVRSLEVQRLPSSKAVPNLVASLATAGIRVRLFDGHGRKLRGYYIGGGTGGELGTAAIMEDSENPYVIHLPMWSGNLRHRYNLRGDDWRSKKIITVDPDRVEELSIDYPKQRSQSFQLKRSEPGGTFTLSPHPGSDRASRQIPRGEAEGMLVRYEQFYASRYENADTRAQTEANTRLPFAVLRIKEWDRPERSLTIYPRFRDPLRSEDLVAYTAWVDDRRDWVLLPVETTQPLLIGYGSF